MQLKKPAFMGLFVLFSAFAVAPETYAQQVQSRPRIAPTKPISKVSPGVQQRPVSAPSNTVVVPNAPRTAVESTVMSRPVAAANAAASSVLAAFRTKLMSAMGSKLGIPYRYGSEGPNTYDCSGLVWTVFTEAGIPFERSSAARFWKDFPEATEEEKKQFGTLIFFNRLGHVGIVIDENTFYHASSSKGVTFSKLEGYWGKRVVGYRRIPLNQLPQSPPPSTAEKAK